MNKYYIDLGASQHLIPTRVDLHAYQEFLKPVEITAANGGVVYAYGSGTLKISSLAKGLVTVLQDVNYTPGYSCAPHILQQAPASRVDSSLFEDRYGVMY